MRRLATVAWIVGALAGCSDGGEPDPAPRRASEAMVGEVTDRSAILQARAVGNDAMPQSAVGRFEVATDPSFADPLASSWVETDASHDFILKSVVAGLAPGTVYYARVKLGADREHVSTHPLPGFRTLDPEGSAAVRLAAFTCMNRAAFTAISDQAELGYPALVAMGESDPDYVVGLGDTVYYDKLPVADTAETMRAKWHDQAAWPRWSALFGKIPGYWLKDDHDFRFNDADLTGSRAPLPGLGIAVFREQVPVVDPEDAAAVTYRTHRVNALLQLWMIEGRDYRSPNDAPDGPAKSLWGPAQLSWLQQTLGESKSPFRVIFHPTPLVGPDDAYKTDNHANLDGFRYERDSFFAWLGQNGLVDEGLVFVVGDRHWQYHSIDASGVHELSVGAFHRENAREGVPPRDGSDPEGTIDQPYLSPEPAGGFLTLDVETEGTDAVATFRLRNASGVVVYELERRRPR